MSETKHWITKLVPAVVYIAAVAMVAVGGIMTVSSALKLALFETEPYTYSSPDECVYDYNRMVPEVGGDSEQPYRLNQEEKELCRVEKEMESKKRFQNLEKQDIVDGVSALLIGGILLFIFRKRK